MNDIKKLTLFNFVMAIVVSCIIFILNIHRFVFLILVVIGIAIGHLSEKLLKINPKNIGGFLGWLASGFLIFLIWSFIILTILFNL